MKVIKSWLSQVNLPEFREEFAHLYGMDFYEYMIRYSVTHISYPHPDVIRHVAFLEYDGTINQLFSLEDDEHLMVYSSGCMAHEGKFFNTDGIAFMVLVREGKRVATFSVENSPYDLEESDFDELDQSKSDILQEIRKLLEANSCTIPVTDSNVLFVQQL